MAGKRRRLLAKAERGVKRGGFKQIVGTGRKPIPTALKARKARA